MPDKVPDTQAFNHTETRRHWSRLLNMVFRKESRVLVEESGIPVAAIVSVDDLNWLRQLDADGVPAISEQPAPSPADSGTSTTSSVSGGSSFSRADDKDCKDFATHAQAQAYFESRGGSTSNNVDRPDNDHDGIACESLP